MNTAYILFAILFITLILFIWDFWRYDVVSFIALMACVVLRIVPVDQAFSGFSNPAVIIVGCVMILSSAVSQTNIVHYAIKFFTKISTNIIIQILSLSTIGAFLACFINNVGALGLMMPIAVQSSLNQNRSPSIVLMPLAFATILGGLITAIGSPTNLIISHYREIAIGSSYQMFDFTKVGIIIAIVGILFISIVGWRLIPKKLGTNKIEDMFNISDYTTEITVEEGSSIIGQKFYQLKKLLNADLTIIGIKRHQDVNFTYSRYDTVRVGDELIIEASANELKKILDNSKIKISHEKSLSTTDLSSEDIKIVEAVVRPDSLITGRSARSMRLRTKYGINLLAVSRTGKSFKQELGNVRLRIGDVVLIQGNAETLQEIITEIGFLPLADRNIKITPRKNDFILSFIFIGAILLAGFHILPIQIIFATAVLSLSLFKIISIESFYNAIDWGILLSIAAMLPIGDAMQTSGAAQLITDHMIMLTHGSSAYVLLTIILIATILLSNIVSNAAAAIIMAPVATQLATNTHINIDTLLMGVVVGATCSFLTPVANQNNLLVMGPGSYRFKDYFILGLPLELIIIITSIPIIVWIWPF